MAKDNDTPQKKLTPKEQLFCIEYCSNGYNASKAAVTAGYSANTCAEIGYENLRKPHIKEEINRLKNSFEELMAEKGITKSVIVLKHWEIANSSIAHLHNSWIERKDFEDLTLEQKACISEIDTKIVRKVFNEQICDIEYIKIKLFDKQKALDSISKIMGYDAPIKQNISLDNTPKVLLSIDGKEISLNNEK